MKKIFSMIIFIIFCLGNICLANDFIKPEIMTLAHEDENAYPWVLKNNEGEFIGIDIEFLNILQKECGVKIKVVAMPWKRCLFEMKNGAIDGVFASSYSEDRKQYGLYPMIGQEPDDSKRIHTSGYSLYHLKTDMAVSRQ